MVRPAHTDRVSGRRLLDQLRVTTFDERVVLLHFTPVEGHLNGPKSRLARLVIDFHADAVDAASVRPGRRAVEQILEQHRPRSRRYGLHRLVVDHVPGPVGPRERGAYLP